MWSLFGLPRRHKATPHRLRTALQVLLAALGSVAFVAGLVTVFTGAGTIPGDNPTTPNVESELRFYAQLLILMGLELILPFFIVWAQARVQRTCASSDA